jgi:hypothetical protein
MAGLVGLPGTQDMLTSFADTKCLVRHIYSDSVEGPHDGCQFLSVRPEFGDDRPPLLLGTMSSQRRFGQKRKTNGDASRDTRPPKSRERADQLRLTFCAGSARPRRVLYMLG